MYALSYVSAYVEGLYKEVDNLREQFPTYKRAQEQTDSAAAPAPLCSVYSKTDIAQLVSNRQNRFNQSN